ncbi:hypothetical protein A8709_29425 [Paenibacillus pectinilyticus]|uniref:FecR protein domain-containing protein n=1 Tax=Paenibacillus pectinilyticus TaxID=512399 RepID=A0A1C0ZV49_9BACL|nr:FecR domain-containing protein [Paenibacillus pectinilyticus]OCT11980.1 hypothetical protein A8709_29425 [Paenibacillus pectinilyticus]
MGMTKKSFVSLFLSFSLIFSLLSVLLVKPVDAKTVRVAIVSALSGDVTVKKGGGSKSYDAYENMSLNQGDTVYTGGDSSVTLNLASGDADVTLGDNAELNVSDLNSSNGNKKSKLKVWAGSMWVKVKSLAGADDEFEVETPTAVMGVRGTQFFVSVDPVSGKTKMAVGAGRVSASTVTTNSDDTQSTTITYVNPTQQISLDSRDETNDLDLKVEFFDLEDFIKQASPEIIKELLLNKAEIDKENTEFIAKKQKEIESGSLTGDKTSLSIKNQSDLDKVKQNLDNLIGNIAKEALAEKKLDQKALDQIIIETNKKITDADKKLDLSKVVPLDKTAGVDPELEKKKQEELKKLEAAKLKAKLEADKKAEDAKKKLADALKKLEDEKKRIEEEKKAAEAKAKADAEAKLKATMSDLEKKQFDLDAQPKSGTPPTDTGSNQGGTTPVTPAPKPVVGMTVTPFSGGGDYNYKLNINLSGFTDTMKIYGVEIHLLTGSQTAFDLSSEHLVKGIFNPATSADSYKIVNSQFSKELIYAVTNFGSEENIEVKNLTSLVTIPVFARFFDQISVGKIVIVSKNADGTVQKIEVPTINQVQVGTETPGPA